MKGPCPLFFFLFSCIQTGFAVHPINDASSPTVSIEATKSGSLLGQLTFEELMTLKPKEIKAKTGHKLRFADRIGLKIAQTKYKKAKKRAAQGKRDKDSLSVLSFIFSVLGFLGFFIPFLFGTFALVGLILGIVALTSPERYYEKDGKGLAIWGVIIGGFVIIVPLLIVALIFGPI